MTAVLLPNCTDPRQQKQCLMLKLSETSDHASMSNNRSVMLISKYHHCPEKSINYTYQNHINSSQTLRHIHCQSAV